MGEAGNEWDTNLRSPSPWRCQHVYGIPVTIISPFAERVYLRHNPVCKKVDSTSSSRVISSSPDEFCVFPRRSCSRPANLAGPVL